MSSWLKSLAVKWFVGGLVIVSLFGCLASVNAVSLWGLAPFFTGAVLGSIAFGALTIAFAVLGLAMLFIGSELHKLKESFKK